MGNNYKKLTAKQIQLLNFFYEERLKHGDGPSLKDTVATLGLSSNRSAIDMIKLLVEKKYLIEGAKISKSTKLSASAIEAIGIKSVKDWEQVSTPRVNFGSSKFKKTGHFAASGTGTFDASSAPRFSRVEQPSGTEISTHNGGVASLYRNSAPLLRARNISTRHYSPGKLRPHRQTLFIAVTDCASWPPDS
jgi:hypothetical protein